MNIRHMRERRLLGLLMEKVGVADMDTLEFLLADRLWGPLGCGCCSYWPDRARWDETTGAHRLLDEAAYQTLRAAERERHKKWREENPLRAAAFDGMVDMHIQTVTRFAGIFDPIGEIRVVLRDEGQDALEEE